MYTLTNKELSWVRLLGFVFECDVLFMQFQVLRMVCEDEPSENIFYSRVILVILDMSYFKLQFAKQLLDNETSGG